MECICRTRKNSKVPCGHDFSASRLTQNPNYTHGEAGQLMPSIEVDFNNCDREGRVRLNTVGVIRSLNESQVTLCNGLEVELTSGDFFPIKGIVEY